jgi:hypothetical protein
MRHLPNAALLLLGVAGCIHQDVPVIGRVAMKELAPNGSVRYIEFDTLGHVVIGQQSGDATPVVHEDTASLGRAQVREIFAAANALGDTLLRHEGTAPREPRGSAVIAILWTDQSQSRIVWTAGTEPADPRVKTLLARINKHRSSGS